MVPIVFDREISKSQDRKNSLKLSISGLRCPTGGALLPIILVIYGADITKFHDHDVHCIIIINILKFSHLKKLFIRLREINVYY